MRRELPNRPHIDHLKKQAKDLLEAHRRAEPEALERVVSKLPAFAKVSSSEAAKAPFALHDAQSTVAREYGFASWNDLRAEVERRESPAVPDAVLRALMGRPLPPEVTAALAGAWDGRGPAEPMPQSGRAIVPLVAFRGALLTPGAVAPIQVARASSLAAVEAALETTPALIAVLTQRDATVEAPRFADLYPIGCVALVKARVSSPEGAFIVVEGQWWATLEAVGAADAYSTVTVRPFEVSEDVTGPERDALVQSLRDRAHQLAEGMPQPDRVVALVDSIRVASRLSDLVVANLPCPVEEKARYAAAPTLGDRLRAAIALCDAQLAAATR